MAGFRIIKDNRKEESILQMEGICPCCDHYPTMYYKTQAVYKRKNATQYHFNCPKCGSEWVGNFYDQNNLAML